MAEGPTGQIEELLPAYALNALDADERQLVERALAESPRYRAALAEYLEGFAQLAESQVVLLPSLDLRDRIMAAASVRGPARRATERGRRERPRRAFRGSWAVAVAASVLVFVGLGGLAAAQSLRVNDLETEMEGLAASAATTQADLDSQHEEMDTLAASAVATQARLDSQLEEMGVLQGTAADMEAKLVSQQELTYFVAHESTSLTRMWAMATPEPTAKLARGMLIEDPDGGRLLMTLFLRPLGSAEAYQAWVWESDETAFSIAVFVVDHSGYALVPVEFPGSEVNVNWVSVNIAPAGGEPTPMGEPVLAGPVEYR